MVEAIRSKVAEICEPLGHKVYAIVNYEGFVLERATSRMPMWRW